MAKDRASPLSPAPISQHEAGSLPPYVSNGLIGLRPRWTPVTGVAIVNGFVGIDPITHTEGFARAPYPLALDLSVDGLQLSDLPAHSALRRQHYDFGTGELTTELSFRAGERTADVRILQLCSRTFPTVCAQQLEVHVDGPCAVQLTVGIDPAGVPGSWSSRAVRPTSTADGMLRWSGHGALSSCGAAYATELGGAEAEPRHPSGETSPLLTTYAFRARSRRRYLTRQLTSLVPEAVHPQPDLQAVRLLHGAARAGFDRVREENRRAWAELWRARPLLIGADERWQALVDAAFFYLHTSAHPSSPCSTSMFGLAYWPDYHYYRGHVMWDIDTFAVPPLLLTNPDAARALLDYRIDRLRGAMQNADANGYRGAQYPWESGPLTGHEAAPGDGEAAGYEHHVSLDVAYALIQYLYATGDREYGHERVKPVLDQVCQWLESRVTRTRRGFEILRANGIAEKAEAVDNNAFVNMAACVVVRETLAVAPELGLEPRPGWEAIAHDLYVPVDPRTRVIRNHDRYRAGEEKGATPEALAGLFPFTYDAAPEVEQSSYAFYLELSERYVGSPMLSALLPTYAARLGRREEALELLEQGYAAFVLQPFSITAEYAPDVFPEQEVAGPFIANIGAFLMTCLYGFTGIQIGAGTPSHWCRRPVQLPSGWEGIDVERLWVRGRPARLTARQGEPHAGLEVDS